MFLFLSKLLPLFLYPLGLACLLLLLALAMIWKRPRLAALAIGVAFLLLVGSSNGWSTDWLVRSLESQYVSVTPLPQADAIVVLGGATKSALPPRPWVEVSEAGDRVLYGAKLYRDGTCLDRWLSSANWGLKRFQLPLITCCQLTTEKRYSDRPKPLC